MSVHKVEHSMYVNLTTFFSTKLEPHERMTVTTLH